MKLDIIRVTKSNWELYKKGILEIEKLCFSKEYAKLVQNEFQIKKTVFADRNIVLIAEYKGSVIGALYGRPSIELYDEKGSHYISNDAFTYYIESIGVSPEFQGIGVSSKLRDELMITAKKEGFKFIEEHSLEPEKIPKNWKVIKKEICPNWVNDKSSFYFKYTIS